MGKVVKILTLAVFMFSATIGTSAWAGQIDVLVDKLVEKGVLTPYEAQILKAEAKEEAAKDLAKGKAVTAPSWTQRIKIKGDVRYRTQINWDKQYGPAHQRIRQRVRARIGLEGKVNDQVTAGVKFVTGGNDPRSTNQTLDDEFETKNVNLDQYWIRWQPELPEGVGSGTLWLGKFSNPFKKTDLVWDGDICPAGSAIQYMSPTFDLGEVPTNVYANSALLWLDEMGTSQRDPLMWGLQGGIMMLVNSDWDSKLDMSICYYDLANVKGNQSANLAEHSSGTNTTWGGRLGNTYRYDYNMLNFLVTYNAKQLFDFELGHGLYADFVWNTDSGVSEDFGMKLGGYLGNKKPKKPGQWKVFGEWRYLERDAVPDFMPDSDFYGYTMSGALAEGGTNAQGVVAGLKYAIFKNTVLGLKYYYTVPIDTDNALANHQDEWSSLIQLDVATKF
jgi:hypothetical protein